MVHVRFECHPVVRDVPSSSELSAQDWPSCRDSIYKLGGLGVMAIRPALFVQELSEL